MTHKVQGEEELMAQDEFAFKEDLKERVVDHIEKHVATEKDREILRLAEEQQKRQEREFESIRAGIKKSLVGDEPKAVKKEFKRDYRLEELRKKRKLKKKGK